MKTDRMELLGKLVDLWEESKLINQYVIMLNGERTIYELLWISMRTKGHNSM